MTSAKSRKTIWAEAAQTFVATLSNIFGFENGEMPLRELDELILESRHRKTEGDRGDTWYTHLRDVIVPEMQKQEIIERTVPHSRTFCKLVPNTTMGNDEQGNAQYYELVALFGQDWVDQNVRVEHLVVPEHTVATYTYIGGGDTGQKLSVTKALGNKPNYVVGLIPLRVKQGKKRQAKTKKEDSDADS